jgi:hypothetical protein
LSTKYREGIEMKKAISFVASAVMIFVVSTQVFADFIFLTPENDYETDFTLTFPQLKIDFYMIDNQAPVVRERIVEIIYSLNDVDPDGIITDEVYLGIVVLSLPGFALPEIYYHVLHLAAAGHVPYADSCEWLLPEGISFMITALSLLPASANGEYRAVSIHGDAHVDAVITAD